jgi:hypothetical protein
MAIALRGTPTSGTAINGGDITLSMPAGLAQGDVVIVGYFMNGAASNTTSSSGWTRIDGGPGTNRLKVFMKVIGSSPDANIVLTGSGSAADSSTACAIAFSGVSNTVPLGFVAVTTATATSTNPDCPSITPRVPGSVSIAYAGTSVVDVTGTAAPAGYSNFTQNSSSDTLSTSSYISWKSGLTSGTAEDPAVYSGVTSALWEAATIVLSPDILGFDPSVGANIPPAFLKKALTASLLLGSIVGPLSPPTAPEAPLSLFDLSVGPNIPPAYLKRVLSTAVRDTASGYEWVPSVPTTPTQYNYGFHNERHLYRPVRPVVARLGTINLAPAEPAPVAVTTTEWIHTAFSQPIRVYQHRRGDVASPPGGFSFQQPLAQTPTEDWWPRWNDPWQLTKPQPRLEGAIAWPGIGYTTDVLVATPSDFWRNRWTDPPAYTRPRYSYGLLGQVAWDPPQQPPPTQYNYGFHDQRHVYAPAKRSVELLGQVSWPGIGYSTVQVVAPPSDWWRTQWSDPPKPAAPRQQGFVAWPGIGYSFAVVVTPPSDWWQQRWQEPQRSVQRATNLLESWAWPGYGYSFTITTLSPGAWAVVPAALHRSRTHYRLAAAWPWQALGFVPPAPTPSTFFFPAWQQWPRQRLRSIYLRQSSWAAWDPQFILQVSPPTPLVGVSFTFGFKRGATVAPGTKEGATMTSQRKSGGATLITRIKPRDS